MSFTIATALARLAAGPRNLCITQNGTMTAPQQLQRANEILEQWYDSDSWRGVRKVVSGLSSVAGVISLPAAYLRADKRLTITTAGHECQYYDIKPLEYQFMPDGPGYWDITKGCVGVAIDLGDNASSIRQYQLTGNQTTLDGYAYTAVLRLRYVYATDTTPIVIPDCYSALELSWRAMNARDEQANNLEDELWAKAYRQLDGNLGQFNEGDEIPPIQIDPFLGMGRVPNLI